MCAEQRRLRAFQHWEMDAFLSQALLFQQRARPVLQELQLWPLVPRVPQVLLLSRRLLVRPLLVQP